MHYDALPLAAQQRRDINAGLASAKAAGGRRFGGARHHMARAAVVKGWEIWCAIPFFPTICTAPLRLKMSGFVCENCGGTGGDMMACSACRLTFYCGPPCQRHAWKTHKTLCKQLQEEAGTLSNDIPTPATESKEPLSDNEVLARDIISKVRDKSRPLRERWSFVNTLGQNERTVSRHIFGKHGGYKLITELMHEELEKEEQLKSSKEPLYFLGQQAITNMLSLDSASCDAKRVNLFLSMPFAYTLMLRYGHMMWRVVQRRQGDRATAEFHRCFWRLHNQMLALKKPAREVLRQLEQYLESQAPEGEGGGAAAGAKKYTKAKRGGGEIDPTDPIAILADMMDCHDKADDIEGLANQAAAMLGLQAKSSGVGKEVEGAIHAQRKAMGWSAQYQAMYQQMAVPHADRMIAAGSSRFVVPPMPFGLPMPLGLG